jgi:hypothetical protein
MVAATVAGPPVATPHQLGRDRRPRGAARAQNLYALRLGPAALSGRQHRHDGDAVDLELGLGA